MPQESKPDKPAQEAIPRPEGDGWERRGEHWERVIDTKKPCRYCNETQVIESTFSFPYCACCHAV